MPDSDRVAAKWLRQKLAERSGDFDIFERPSGKGGESAPPALFDRPPELFERPPGAPGRPPAAPEPAPAPTPPAAERPRAPAPAAPPAPEAAPPAPPPRDAPPGRGRPAPFGEETQAMRRTQDFKQFLREKYEKGQAKILHPDPEKRQRRKDQNKDPSIKFWSAMKYDTFKAKVKKEFEAWRQEAEAARPRGQIGDQITSVGQVRLGDFLQGQNYPIRGYQYKVVRMTPRRITLQRVDRNGRPKGTKLRHYDDRRLQGWRGKMNRIEEVKRPDVELTEAKKFIDERVGHPPRTVDTKDKYRSWMEKQFLEGKNSPYFRLDDDEQTHKTKLKEHVEKILEARNIGDDWSWAAPPHVGIGDRVTDPFQLHQGDFVQYYHYPYKVVEVTDDGKLKLQRVTPHGRPQGAPMTWDRRYLDQYRVNRITPVERQAVDAAQAKAFADDTIGFPDRRVGSQQEYREWLEKKFTESTASPYYQLGDDETKHKKSLKKQIEKILDHRGVGSAWTWQPPPHAEIGDRIHDPFQLHTGDFFSQNERYGYKVLEVLDDGRIKAVKVSMATGRPEGVPTEFERGRIERGRYKRLDEIVRPEVSFEEAKKYANDKIGYPPPRVNTKSEYREWLEKKFTEKATAPFYQLGDDEEEHKAKLDKYVKKLLDERGVGSSWSWEPPPQADIGQRVTDPLQLRVGDFVARDGHSGGYRVVEINPDGKAKMLRIDSNGRPTGEVAYEWDASTFARAEYKRSDVIKRPEVTPEKARSFADQYAMEPGRAVRNQDKYREWLNDEFVNNTHSPYYQLADDEPEHQEKLKKRIEKILADRNIGADWTWRPPPLVELPSDEEWQQKHDALRRMVLDGEKKGADKRLGGGGINGGKRRRMKIGNEDHEFVFKDKAKERGDGVRSGTPTGTLHLREQAAYTLDRLLGEGTVVPATVSDGTGSYQAFVQGANNWSAGNRGTVSTSDLKRHPEVQRTVLIDVLMGHEDRHSNNLMFSWIDPSAPRTVDNIRFHAIDNGYAFAHPDSKNSASDYVVRHPWADEVVKSVIERIPDELHEKLKEIKPKDLLKTLVDSGIKDKGALETAAFRLLALQDNPEVLGKIMRDQGRGTHAAQQRFHWLASKEPEELLRDYTDLPASTADEIKKQVQDAVA